MIELQSINLFLIRVATFLALPTLCVAVLIRWSAYKNERAIQRYEFKDKNLVLIGDSHVQSSMNDSIIKQSINLSQQSESFYFSYYKLKKLINDGIVVRRVYLGFGFHSLAAYYEDFVFGKYSFEIAPKYFFSLPASEQWKFVVSNRSNLYQFTKNIISSGLNPSFLGQYKNEFYSQKINYRSVDERIAFQFYVDEKSSKFSSLSLDYLGRIVELCSERGIDLVFLNTPLHSYYRSKIPQEYIDRYWNIVNQFQTPVLDFSNTPMDDSSFVPDGDHVSVKGARIVSDRFSKQVGIK